MARYVGSRKSTTGTRLDIFIHRSMIFIRKVFQGALVLALLTLTGCNDHRGKYSILFGGDVILARAGKPVFLDEGSGLSPWGEVLTIRKHFPDGVFVANLESPFGEVPEELDPELREMNLCAPVALALSLEKSGLDLVTFANNHAADCALPGRDLTIDTLHNVGITGRNSSFEDTYVSEKGQEIAIIALDAYSDGYDLAQVKQNIRTASIKNQLVVVSIHWGMEYQAGPDVNQESLASELVDAGADVIWGHHPHVLQKMEWTRSTIDGHNALVMYSLGNLVADQWMLSDAQKTALVRLDIKQGKVVRIVVIPLIMDLSTRRLVFPSSEDEVNQIIERVNLHDMERRGVSIELWLGNFD